MVFTVSCVQSGGKMTMGDPKPLRDALATQTIASYGTAERVEMDQHGVYVPVRAGEAVLGVLVIQRYPNHAHYRMIEPVLTVGMGIFSDRLHSLRGELSGFFEWLRESLAPARAAGQDVGADDPPDVFGEVEEDGEPLGSRVKDPFVDGSDHDDFSLPSERGRRDAPNICGGCGRCSCFFLTHQRTRDHGVRCVSEFASACLRDLSALCG